MKQLFCTILVRPQGGCISMFFLIGLFALSGCTASQYLGSTTASYKIIAGAPEVFYQSNKNQEGFKADLELDEAGKPKKFHVETTAMTPEAAIAAAMQVNLALQAQLGDIIKLVAPLITSAIAGGSNVAPKPIPAPAPGSIPGK